MDQANNYTNIQVANTLDQANSYTDTQVSNEARARENGDEQTLNRANSYTNSKFASLNNSIGALSDKVDTNRRRADAGTAGAMAMTAIPVVYGKEVSFGMAMSSYRDQGALAAGFNFRTSESSAIKINTAWDAQNGVGVAAGLAMGW